MRKIYILFLLSITTSLTYAQTITPDWFFAIGDSLQQVAITNVNDFEEPTSGLNQAWDYTTIIPAIDTSTANFIDPSTLITNDDFRNADVATSVPGLQEIFYATDGDSLTILGLSIFGEYGLVQVIYDQGAEEIIGVDQMAFGDTIFNNIFGDILLDGYSIQTFTSEQVISFDGIGSLQLPEISLDNCVLFTNSIFQNEEEVARVSTIYFNSFSNPVLLYQTQTDAYGQQTTVMAKSITDNLSTSISEIDLLQADIHSDLSGNIYVGLEESIDATVQIVSMNGQVVAYHQEYLSTGKNQLSLDNNLTAGIYVVLVVDKNTGRFNSHKLSIMR